MFYWWLICKNCHRILSIKEKAERTDYIGLCVHSVPNGRRREFWRLMDEHDCKRKEKKGYWPDTYKKKVHSYYDERRKTLEKTTT